MSFYFRDRPKFGDKLRGKSGDEILEKIKQQFDEDSKSFFEPTNRRDLFERNSTFPRGFPFDKNGFGPRSDIRAHLDDLAARHPELADHLLGPPWGDVPVRSSFHNRNCDSGNAGRNNYQAYSDEDARSQASGSSAASGTSAASSHSEGDSYVHSYQEKPSSYDHTNQRNQIPQYGLRNTVDIGQHHHSMDNSDKVSRGQRSMSAPPENRQSSNQQQQMQQQEPQQSESQGQRYVSRIDITPQHNQPQQQQQSQPQQKPQQQSNVRHIPIFVEGRDEPVLPRSFDEPPNFKREPSPTQFQRPNLHSRSPFGPSFVTRHHRWPPHFEDSFSPMQSEFEQPTRRQQQVPSFQQPRQQQYTEKQPQQQQYTEKLPQQQHYEQSKQYKPQQQPQAQQQQQQQFQQELPKPKSNVPKDPMDKVALVQKEVDSLAEQVREYKGNSRTDKEYIYLDEMLTRELIKLDDIETEGRDNVRQARKNAIRSIQETISLLESKAPLPGRQVSPEDGKIQQDRVSCNVDEPGQTDSIEVDQNVEESPQNKEPIPLPPVPSSSPQKQNCEEIEQSSEDIVHSSTNDQLINNDQQEVNQSASEIMVTAAEQLDAIAIDVQQSSDPDSTTKEQKVEDVSEEKKLKNTTEVKTIEDIFPEESKLKNDTIKEQKVAVGSSDEPQTESASKKKKGEESEEEKEVVANIIKNKESEDKMEIGNVIKRSPKLQNKGKKTKKQTAPLSDKPIPLPAPASSEASTK